MAISVKKQVTNNSGTGYCKMPDGTLMCWGVATIPTGQYVVDVNYPLQFPNRDQLSIQLTPINGVPTSYNVNYNASTTAKFNFGKTPNTMDSSFYWLAIGRWK